MVEQNKDTPKRSGLTARSLVELAAFPVAAGVGYKAGELLIRRGSYKNVADTKINGQPGLLDELQAEHKVRKRAILEQAGKETTVEGRLEQLRAYYNENKEFRKLVKDKFKGMGFTDITKHWAGLHPNQRTDAIIFGATAAGILLGAVLLVTQNQALSNTLARREAEREERGRC